MVNDHPSPAQMAKEWAKQAYEVMLDLPARVTRTVVDGQIKAGVTHSTKHADYFYSISVSSLLRNLESTKEPEVRLYALARDSVDQRDGLTLLYHDTGENYIPGVHNVAQMGVGANRQMRESLIGKIFEAYNEVEQKSKESPESDKKTGSTASPGSSLPKITPRKGLPRLETEIETESKEN